MDLETLQEQVDKDLKINDTELDLESLKTPQLHNKYMKHYTKFKLMLTKAETFDTDNIHSFDLANMFWNFYQNPRSGEIYNTGGARHSNCSILEAIQMCEEITGNRMNYIYSDANRIGDHIWYISDIRKFKSHYPKWDFQYNLHDILSQIYKGMKDRV